MVVTDCVLVTVLDALLVIVLANVGESVVEALLVNVGVCW